MVVNGRFHAFDYAKELHKQNNLDLLISSMPYFVAKKFGIPRQKYIGLPIFEVLKRIWPIIFNKEINPVIYSRLFTYTSSLFISSKTSCIICNAGTAYEIFNKKKFSNKLKILDRGSSHTLQNILQNNRAAKYHDIVWKSHSEAYINRELKEYEICDLIIVPSSYAFKSFVENNVPSNKVKLNPFPFLSNRFNVKKTYSSNNAKSVLYVGQINHLKGVGVLINAMKIVNQNIKVELNLVGTINDKFPRALLNHSWCNYLGVLKGADLQLVYEKSSIFCFLTYDDGFGLVLSEAAYFEKYIIATPNSASVDLNLIYKNMTIVPEEDSILVAKNILNYFQNNQITFNKNITQIQFKTWGDYTQNLINIINAKIDDFKFTETK